MGFLNNSIFLVIIIVSIIFNQIVIRLPVVAAKDVLNPSPGDELNSSYSTSTLLSQDGQFTLGVFAPSFTNFMYLAIQYTNDMTVWVANRDSPMMMIDASDAVLTIDDSGTMKVVNGNGMILFNVFINPFGRGNNTRAVLKNSGNFVVYDATDNQTLWESFDYPTDTLVPGMKLGYNFTTNQSWTLTSGLSNVFLTTGAFTMRLEEYQNSPQLVIYRRGELYWASGPWNYNEGTFQFVDSDAVSNYGFQLYADATSMYLISETIVSPSTMLQLSPLGNFFDGSNEIVTPEFCYGYQSDHGCAKAEAALPSCRGQSDTIQLKKGDWIGDFTYNHDYNSSIGISDCMERCWNNCSCIGFSTNDTGMGCYTYTGDALFQYDELSKKIQKYVVVSQNPPKTDVPVLKKTRAKKTWIRIGVPVVLVLTSVSGAFLCYVMIQRRKHEEEKRKLDFINQLARSDSFNFGDELEKGIKDAPNVKVFSFKAISVATNNFSNENKLGKGGYGPVYKGRLSDGRELAVKRLSKTSGQGIDEFKTELVLISKLQHTNLV